MLMQICIFSVRTSVEIGGKLNLGKFDEFNGKRWMNLKEDNCEYDGKLRFAVH